MNEIYIENIPSIIWNEKSDKVFIFVHGKMSSKENALYFAEIAAHKNYQVLSFDLPKHGARKDEKYKCDIWNGINDLTKIYNYAYSRWKSISIFGCSLGAFFSLHAYKDKVFEKCLFHSPILDMEYLIKQMFLWFNISEDMLKDKKEIETPIDTLSWDYYQYVKENPIVKWQSKTNILYGLKDNLQSIDIIKNFARRFNSILTISENSEHAFMEEKDLLIVSRWFKDNI